MGSADQAARLRQLFNKKQQAVEAPSLDRARVIAVSSGKGGVGKTNVTANMAIALAAKGKRVAILDADYALANIDILLGFNPKYTIENVLDGSMSVGDILVDGPGGIKVVPASSGVQQLTNLSDQQLKALYNALQILEKYFDHILIDTAAGISEEVLHVLRAAGEIVVVTNPEPPAFVDSYALIKHLINTKSQVRIRIVVNQVDDEADAKTVFDRIAKTVEKFLKRNVEYLGFITDDKYVKKAVRARKPFILEFPNCAASRCIRSLAHRLLNEKHVQSETGFWSNLKAVIGRN